MTTFSCSPHVNEHVSAFPSPFAWPSGSLTSSSLLYPFLILCPSPRSLQLSSPSSRLSLSCLNSCALVPQSTPSSRFVKKYCCVEVGVEVLEVIELSFGGVGDRAGRWRVVVFWCACEICTSSRSYDVLYLGFLRPQVVSSARCFDVGESLSTPCHTLRMSGNCFAPHLCWVIYRCDRTVTWSSIFQIVCNVVLLFLLLLHCKVCDVFV